MLWPSLAAIVSVFDDVGNDMSAQYGLFLGEDRIPVINWINRHGAPEGRELRFTVPTEVKSKLESNKDATFRIERDGQRWEFELISVTQHGTGTNGVPAVGRVKVANAPLKPQAKPKTGVGIPSLDGASTAGDGGFGREKSSLKDLLLKKKEERRTEAGVPAASADPETVSGLPSADEVSEAEVADGTQKGMPPVVVSKPSGEEE